MVLCVLGWACLPRNLYDGRLAVEEINPNMSSGALWRQNQPISVDEDDVCGCGCQSNDHHDAQEARGEDVEEWEVVDHSEAD